MSTTREIILTDNRRAIIDSAKYGSTKGFKWNSYYSKRNCTWYAVTSVRLPSGRVYNLTLHRLIALGLDFEDRRTVVHINNNGLDNRFCNLQIVEEDNGF